MGFRLNQKVTVIGDYFEVLKGLVGVINTLPTFSHSYYHVSFNSGRFGLEQIWYFMEEDLKPASNYFYAI